MAPALSATLQAQYNAHHLTNSSLYSFATSSLPEDDSNDGEQLFFVSSYTNFDRLAHGPRGAEAKHPVYIYKFCPSDGSMVLLNVSTGEVDDENNTTNQSKDSVAPLINPAFTRFNPRINVVYTCTEDVLNNGVIVAYKINEQGALQNIGSVDAGGTSTCYITIDSTETHLIATNYWNSTLTVIPICYKTGAFLGPIQSTYDPKGGCSMQAAAKKNGGVNHSNNDASTIQERQKDPHSHALVLDPFQGCIAYVPDLGKDLIRELYYDRQKGVIVSQVNVLPSGLSTGKPDGPRYIEFHPKYDIAYVVNELSCTIAVFSVDRAAIDDLSKIDIDDNKLAFHRFTNAPTLKLIQSIKTVPDAFPTSMNTCGRVTVHPSGNFVIVSNRGHESIAIFRVCKKGSTQGHLRNVGFFHTYGETPRHFQFDASGQYLIVANQDSNSIAVFSFNLSSGEIKFTGNKYRVPSPNFVCNCIVLDDASNTLQALPQQQPGSSSSSSSVKDGSSSDHDNHQQEQNNGEVMIHVNHNNEQEEATSTVWSQEELMLELCKAREEIRSLKARLGE